MRGKHHLQKLSTKSESKYILQFNSIYLHEPNWVQTHSTLCWMFGVLKLSVLFDCRLICQRIIIEKVNICNLETCDQRDFSLKPRPK